MNLKYTQIHSNILHNKLGITWLLKCISTYIHFFLKVSLEKHVHFTGITPNVCVPDCLQRKVQSNRKQKTSRFSCYCISLELKWFIEGCTQSLPSHPLNWLHNKVNWVVQFLDSFIFTYTGAKKDWHPYLINTIEMRSLWTEMKHLKNTPRLLNRSWVN